MLWLAIDPLTKLVPAYAVAPRKTPDAMAFLHHFCDRLASGHIPLFLSDGLRQYHAVLIAHFGTWVNGDWHVSPQPHLTQIVKVLRSRRLVVTFPRALCGSLRHARHLLHAHGFSGIIRRHSLSASISPSVTVSLPFIGAPGRPVADVTAYTPMLLSTSPSTISSVPT